MPQEIQTVLLSLATSLIVSMITFILGLKSGKNQTDRAKLQKIYQQLHSHFEDLKESLLRDSPKSWINYKKVEHGLSTEYFPPVKEMNKTGELLFIKEKIAKEAIDLETSLMKFSSKLNYNIPDIHKSLISDLSLYKEGFSFKKYQGQKDETAHFETVNPDNCKSYQMETYLIFFNKERFIQRMKRFVDSKSYSISFSSNGNPATYSFSLYPNGLAVSIEEYTRRIFDNFSINIDEYERLCLEKDKLITRIDKINKKIARRVREPVSFWETLLGAFIDMFR